MKYAGQDQQYLKGAWRGDGVPSQVPTKEDRDNRRALRRAVGTSKPTDRIERRRARNASR